MNIKIKKIYTYCVSGFGYTINLEKGMEKGSYDVDSVNITIEDNSLLTPHECLEEFYYVIMNPHKHLARFFNGGVCLCNAKYPGCKKPFIEIIASRKYDNCDI